MNLHDELLRQIFEQLDSCDMNQTVNVSQVCSRWRFVALGQRNLWNRIAIKTPRDGSRVPLALERSGSAALDVKLLWAHRYQ
jgi:hypothetical protein